MASHLLSICAVFGAAHAVWHVKRVSFVNDCSSRVFVLGVGWVSPGTEKVVKPGDGAEPFRGDRVPVSYEELYLMGLDRHMNVLEMNDGRIRDTGSSFALQEPHLNLMGYFGWYNLSMEITTWAEDESAPFCTSGFGGARTIVDFGQCQAHGGKILLQGPGEVCTKPDESHLFCATDTHTPLYQFLLRSTSHWKADQTWESDADTSTPLSSFLCDPIPASPPRGVGFMIGCKPRSEVMGRFQVRLCPRDDGGNLASVASPEGGLHGR